MLYGLWCAVSVALPMQLIAIGFMTNNLNLLVAIPGGMLLVAHVAGIPIWQRRQRHFRCSTEWARQNEIKPQELTFFSW